MQGRRAGTRALNVEVLRHDWAICSKRHRRFNTSWFDEGYASFAARECRERCSPKEVALVISGPPDVVSSSVGQRRRARLSRYGSRQSRCRLAEMDSRRGSRCCWQNGRARQSGRRQCQRLRPEWPGSRRLRNAGVDGMEGLQLADLSPPPGSPPVICRCTGTAPRISTAWRCGRRDEAAEPRSCERLALIWGRIHEGSRGGQRRKQRATTDR